jgi:hypothetical protein
MWRKRADKEKALLIECPDCHAAPGEWCKRPSGRRYYVFMHQERF